MIFGNDASEMEFQSLDARFLPKFVKPYSINQFYAFEHVMYKFMQGLLLGVRTGGIIVGEV